MRISRPCSTISAPLVRTPSRRQKLTVLNAANGRRQTSLRRTTPLMRRKHRSLTETQTLTTRETTAENVTRAIPLRTRTTKGPHTHSDGYLTNARRIRVLKSSPTVRPKHPVTFHKAAPVHNLLFPAVQIVTGGTMTATYHPCRTIPRMKNHRWETPPNTKSLGVIWQRRSRKN